MKIFNGLKNFIKMEKVLLKVIITGILFVPSVVSAQWVIGAAPDGLNANLLGVILTNVIIGILGIIGVLGILYLVYGGIRYVTSAGSDSEIEEAKKIVTNAIYGLFFVAASYAIVSTVVSYIG